MPIVHGTPANNTLNGTWQNDEIYGYDGHDTLNGGSGADTLVGGTGNDVYITDGGDTLVELAGEGTDEVRSSVSHTLGDHFELLRLLGTASINGTGNSANNTLWGNSGHNVLDGGGGNDILRGLLGDDIYITDGGDTLVESANQGIDEVRASVSFTLGNHFENLTLTGSAHLSGTGNAANNVITGNAGDNHLNGGGGIDTFQMTATPGLQATANLATGVATGQGNDTLLNFENVRGTPGADQITGDAGNNLLDGAGGSDELFASGGIDTLVGGEGHDAVRFDFTGAATVNLATGSYSLGAAGSGTLSSITHVQGSGFDDHITGNADRNHLHGGAGNDTVVSGGGQFDIVWGGAGSDRLVAEGGSVNLGGDSDMWSNLDDDAPDVFEVRPLAGSITIGDFQPGVDKLDLSGFGFDAQGLSATWSGSATASGGALTLTLTGAGTGTVTIALQGVSANQFQASDMIGGSPALLPSTAVPGGNGVADVWVIDPWAIIANQQGVLNLHGFEDGLDVVDLRALALNSGTYWGGTTYAVGPNFESRMEFWGLGGQHFVINLVGHAYVDLDIGDVLL